MFAEACANGWEGVIAKRADSVYTTSAPSDWLKFKCEQGQELVIGGFTPPQGLADRVRRAARRRLRRARPALRRQGRHGLQPRDAAARWPRSCGRWSARTPRSTTPRASATSPGSSRELVAQCGFAEWTRDGRLRHPRFLGLRDDKDPRKVVRESGP